MQSDRLDLQIADRCPTSAPGQRLRTLLFGCCVSLGLCAPAFALSEIQREDIPLPSVGGGTGDLVPQQGPLILQDEPPDIQREPLPAPDPQVETPQTEPQGTEAVPEILRDLSLLPEPVRRMRDMILQACLAGDLEALRPLIGTGDAATQLSMAGIGDDPIAFLQGMSGDDHGHEILAILAEVLEAPFVHLDEGGGEELYVWPYFFAVPLESLDAPQRVELFRLVTAGDYEDMKSYGAYIFYRVGITPEGRWAFFVAGD